MTFIMVASVADAVFTLNVTSITDAEIADSDIRQMWRPSRSEQEYPMVRAGKNPQELSVLDSSYGVHPRHSTDGGVSLSLCIHCIGQPRRVRTLRHGAGRGGDIDLRTLYERQTAKDVKRWFRGRLGKIRDPDSR